MPDRERAGVCTVVVTGTETEVGKTWLAVRLLKALRARRLQVAGRKPAQSYVAGDGPTDADLIAEATGESPTAVCPAHRWYPLPMAPPMAAEALKRPPFSLRELLAEVIWPASGLVLVECAGGVRSPLAADGDAVDLIGSLRPQLVILVADAGLGTINATRLAADALRGWPLVVFLNRFNGLDRVHAGNRAWLVRQAGLDAVTTVEEVLVRIPLSGSR